MLRMNPIHMSPFLADVQVYNVTGNPDAASTPEGSPPTPDSMRALAEKVRAKAMAKAAKDLDAAGKSMDSQGVTLESTPSRHNKSSDDSNDAVFAVIPIVAIVFTFLYLITKAIMAPFTNRTRHSGSQPMAGGGLSDEEVAALMKLQRTLVQMESRVEALETILIEQSRNKEKYGSKL